MRNRAGTRGLPVPTAAPPRMAPGVRSALQTHWLPPRVTRGGIGTALRLEPQTAGHLHRRTLALRDDRGLTTASLIPTGACSAVAGRLT